MSQLLSLAAPVQASSDGGLTIHEILASMPSDPLSLFVIALLAVSAVLIFWAGRPRGKGGRPA